MAHEFAVRLASIAFAAATAQGAITGADFQSTLKTALVVLGVFYGLGFVCGEIARLLVEENVTATTAQRPPAAAGGPEHSAR